MVFVGANLDNTNGRESGAAYLFDLDGAWPTREYPNPDGGRGDFWGYAVDASNFGETLIIGAYFWGDKVGIYNTLTSYTVENPTAVRGEFGHAVSISDDGRLAVIGAHNDATDGYNTGKAYLLDTLTGQLTEIPAPADRDSFGYDVTISGDGTTIAVSTYYSWSPIYVYDTSTLSLIATLDDGGGYAVDISDDGKTIIVGASGETAFVYELQETSGTADLSLSGALGPDEVMIGDTVGLIYTLTNDGPDAASGVEVSLDLNFPEGMIFADSSAEQGDFDADSFVWSVGGIGAGESATLNLTAQAIDIGTFGVTAEVTSSGAADPDSTPDNNDADEDDQAQLIFNATPEDDVTRIEGTEEWDRLVGTRENETISGRKGNDTLYGRRGDDNLFGNEGNDRLYGNAGDDEIFGGKGNDRLFGGSGNDRLEGGRGNDVINGGGGQDTAIFDGDFEDFSISRGRIRDLNPEDPVDPSGPQDEGFDRFRGVEFLEFDDGVLNVRTGVFDPFDA